MDMIEDGNENCRYRMEAQLKGCRGMIQISKLTKSIDDVEFVANTSKI